MKKLLSAIIILCFSIVTFSTADQSYDRTSNVCIALRKRYQIERENRNRMCGAATYFSSLSYRGEWGEFKINDIDCGLNVVNSANSSCSSTIFNMYQTKRSLRENDCVKLPNKLKPLPKHWKDVFRAIKFIDNILSRPESEYVPGIGKLCRSYFWAVFDLVEAKDLNEKYCTREAIMRVGFSEKDYILCMETPFYNATKNNCLNSIRDIYELEKRAMSIKDRLLNYIKVGKIIMNEAEESEEYKHRSGKLSELFEWLKGYANTTIETFIADIENLTTTTVETSERFFEVIKNAAATISATVFGREAWAYFSGNNVGRNIMNIIIPNIYNAIFGGAIDLTMSIGVFAVTFLIVCKLFGQSKAEGQIPVDRRAGAGL